MAVIVNLSGLFIAAFIAVFFTLTAAAPFSDIVEKAMLKAKVQLEQKQQQLQQQHHLQKRQTDSCALPTNLAETFQQINAHLDTTHFANRAVGGQAVTSNPTDTARFLGAADPNESKTCPTSITKLADAPLSHRSLCPFRFDVLELPTGYYPPTLKWAKCKCTNCIENNVYACETVETPIAVLKPTGCFQGMQQYEEQILHVPTSCACAFKGYVQSHFELSTEGTTTTTATTPKPSWGANIG